MQLSELARRIEAQLVGDGAVEVTAAATLEDARPGQVSFLTNPKYAAQLQTTRASAVIVAPSVACDHVALLKSPHPHYAFCKAVVALHGYRKHPHQSVHPKAHVEPSAEIGEGTVVYPGCYVGARVKIGRDCILFPNVVVYEDCELRDRVTLHAGVVVGQDGFGYATHQGVHHKIPQTGNVLIEDDCEIGSNSVIERASLGTTVVGRGTKTDGGVIVGHGTKIGAHGLLVAQVGIAGSVTIGHHVTIAGQCGIAGHLKIGDNVTIAAQAGVMNDIPDQTVVMGAPAMPIAQARRVYTTFTQLPDLVERLKALEQKVEELSTEDQV
jgi:UDP-3-O-[3-hydroxymyristoyl] glucosamine N-acyltransferase